MELPGVQDLLLPLLTIMADQREYRISEMVDHLADQIVMETNSGLPSRSLTRGNKAIFYSHVVGARSYLAHAGLIENPRREVSRITPRGVMLLAENPKDIDLLTLAQYPEFIEYMQNEKSAHSDPLLIKLAESLGQPKEEPSKESLLSSVSNLLREMEEDDRAQTDELEPLDFHEETNGVSALPPSPPPPLIDIEEESLQINPLESVKSMMESPLETIDLDPTPRREQEHVYRSRDTREEQIPTPTKISRKTGYGGSRREFVEAEEKQNPLTQALLVAARYLENFFTYKWSYLLILLLTTMGYVASYFLIEDKFASQGIIYVQSDTLIQEISGADTSDFGIYITPAEQTADELKELLNTNAFLRLIISKTELEENMDDGIVVVNETIEDVFDAIEVDWTGTNNVVVRATWEDRAVAMDLADSALNTFIDWKITSDRRDSQAALEFLEEIVPQYQNEYQLAVENLEAYLIQHPEPFRGDRPEIEEIQITQLQNEISDANDRLKSAQENLEQVRLEQVIVEGKTRQTYSILDSPLGNTPIDPVGGLTQEVINFAIFTAVGLAIMLLAIGATTLLDQSIKFPKEVSAQLNENILTQVYVEEKPRSSKQNTPSNP